MSDLNRNITENIHRYLARPNNGQAILIEGPWGCGKTHFINTFIENEKLENLKLIKVSVFGVNSIPGVENRILSAFYPILDNKLAKLAMACGKSLSAKFGADLSGDGRPDAQGTLSVGKINLYELLVEGRTDFALVLDDIERTSIKPQELLGYINHIVEACQIKTILIGNESELWKGDTGDYIRFKEKVISKTFHVAHDADAVIEHFLKDGAIQFGKFKPIIIEAYAITKKKNLRSLQQVIDDFFELYQQLDCEYQKHEQYTSALAKTFFSLALSVKSASTEKKDLEVGDVLKSSSAFMKEYFATGRPVLSEVFWVRALFYSDYSTLNFESSKQHFFIQPSTSEMDVLEKLSNFENLEDKEFQGLLITLESEVKNGQDQQPYVYIKKAAVLASMIAYKLSRLNSKELASHIRSYTHNSKNFGEWSHFEPEKLVSYYSEHIEASPILKNAYDSFYEDWNSAYEAEQFKQGTEQRESKASEFYQALMNNDRDTLVKILIKDNSYTAFLTTLNAERFANTLLEAPNASINSFKEIVGGRYSSYSLGSNSNNSLYPETKFWSEACLAIKARMKDAAPLKKHNLERFIGPAVANFTTLISRGTEEK